MATIIAVQSTKGGVGKTTVAFNMGTLLADLGYNTLLIDVDVQGSLSKACNVQHGGTLSSQGLVELLHEGKLTEEMISHTRFPNLDIVMSNDFSDRHENELAARIDRSARIKRALNSPIAAKYQVIILDSKGAIGALQDAASTAADIILTPISPDKISSLEYISGSKKLIENLSVCVEMGLIQMPKVYAFLNRMDRTHAAKAVAEAVIKESRLCLGQINVMQTAIPYAKAFTEAMAYDTPVHIHEFSHAGKSASAYLIMHLFVWEIFPSLKGVFSNGWGKFSNEQIENHYGEYISHDFQHVDAEGGAA